MTPPAPKLRLAVVPLDPTEDMASAGYDAMRDPSTNLPAPWVVLGTAVNVHAAVLAASPNRGLLPADMLERAAEGHYRRSYELALEHGHRIKPWERCNQAFKDLLIEQQRAAFEAAGIECEKEGG